MNMIAILVLLLDAAADRAAAAGLALLEAQGVLWRPGGVIASLARMEPIKKAEARYEREDLRHQRICRALDDAAS